MKIQCSSLGCSHEEPVPYCKECSHAHWKVNDDISFNPHFGFDSKKEIDWISASEWHEKFEIVDIKDCSFETFK